MLRMLTEAAKTVKWLQTSAHGAAAATEPSSIREFTAATVGEMITASTIYLPLIHRGQ